MTRICLVYPPIYGAYGNPESPPVGLAYLAAVLKKENFDTFGYDMRVIEQRSTEKLLEFIENNKIDLVAISSPSFWFDKTIEIVSSIRKKYNNKTIVLGGPHASVYEERIFEIVPQVDYAIVGEGEASLVKLLKNESMEKIPGLIYRSNGTVKKNERYFETNLDSLPYPDYDAFGMEKYNKNVNELVLPLLTSRGCPFNCVFCCGYKIAGRVYRPRSPENVVDEIIYMQKKYGTKSFMIVDDNFSMSKERVVRFCNLLLDKRLEIKWGCAQGVRGDALDYETFSLMKKTGCDVISIGVESSNQKILDASRKGVKIETIEKSIENAKKAGLIVKTFFIVGLPNQTFRDVEDDIKFFKRMDVDIARVSMMVPYPGTEMSEWVKNNAKILIQEDDFINKYAEVGETAPIFETSDFTATERAKAFGLATFEAERWTFSKIGERFMNRYLPPLATPTKKIFYYLSFTNITLKIFRGLTRFFVKLMKKSGAEIEF